MKQHFLSVFWCASPIHPVPLAHVPTNDVLGLKQVSQCGVPMNVLTLILL